MGTKVKDFRKKQRNGAALEKQVFPGVEEDKQIRESTTK